MAKRLKVDPETEALIEAAITEARAMPGLMGLADYAVGFADLDDEDPDDEDADFRSEFTERQRDLIAAAILYSCDVPTDGLGLDEDNLIWHVEQGKEFDVENSWILWRLPRQLWPRIDVPFVARFSAALKVVAFRFREGWSMPRNVAEELATRLLVEGIAFELELWEVQIPPQWVEYLQEVLYEDLDHETLFATTTPSTEVAKAMGYAPMGFDDLFDAFRDSEPVEY